MPLIVDKNAIRNEILQTFQLCTYDKPITKITMRDVAAKANISHAKIIYYFESRHQLLLAYVEYMTDLYVQFFHDWLADIQSGCVDITNPRGCVNQILKDIAAFDNTKHTRAFIQIYSLVQYDNTFREPVERTYRHWRSAITEILEELYGRQMEETADALLVLIEGILLYSINDTLSSKRIEHILDCFIGL